MSQPLDLVDDPCWRCAVRADLGCRHYPPRGSLPVALRRKHFRIDRRSLNTDLRSYNFGSSKAKAMFQAMQRMKALLR